MSKYNIVDYRFNFRNYYEGSTGNNYINKIHDDACNSLTKLCKRLAKLSPEEKEQWLNDMRRICSKSFNDEGVNI